MDLTQINQKSKLIPKSILLYFKLSFSKFARDLQNTQTQNSNTQKLKTQAQTQTFEYFWVQMSGHRKMQEMLTVCSNVNTDPIKYASAKLITVPTKKT